MPLRANRMLAHCVSIALSVGAIVAPAGAQEEPPAPLAPASAATSTDAYGNVQFGLPERRPLGLYQFDTGTEGTGTTLFETRRERRGGETLFSLPGDLLGLTTVQSLSDTVSPGVMAIVSQRRARAFRLYGGFGVRYTDIYSDPISNAFARQSTLLSATSEAAPVYRALAENSSLAGVRSAVIQTPFDQAASGSLESPISLFQQLDTTVAASHARTASEAWGLFKDGAYRPAARAFQSALVLDSESLEERVGEMFCYVLTGSIRTAMAITSDLSNHTDNEFSVNMDIASRFGDSREADQLATSARLALESLGTGRTADLDATYILVLWYLGRKDVAERSVASLPRAEGGSKYSDWPAKLRAAQTESGVGAVNPNASPNG